MKKNLEEELDDLLPKIKEILVKIIGNSLEEEMPDFLVIGNERFKIEDVLYLEANNQYTNIGIYTSEGIIKKIGSKNLGYYEAHLPKFRKSNSKGFLKIHKSYIVNKAHVRKVVRNTKKAGKCYLLSFEDSLPISDTLFTTVKDELNF